MIEGFLGVAILVWGIMLTWWFIVPFSLFTLWACAKDEPRFFAFFASAVLSSIAFTLLGFGWPEFKIYLIAYLPVGLLWSSWRWDRYAKYMREQSYDRTPRMAADSEDQRKNWFKNQMDIERNLTRITHWVVSWPISVVCWTLAGFINFIKDLIVKYFRKVYEAIAERYV